MLKLPNFTYIDKIEKKMRLGWTRTSVLYILCINIINRPVEYLNKTKKSGITYSISILANFTNHVRPKFFLNNTMNYCLHRLDNVN